MNPLDIAVIAIVALSAVFAFARGLVREALSIVAWVGAAAITVYGFHAAYTLIEPSIKNPLVSQIVAGVGLFLISLIVLTILTGFVARYVRASALSPIDRTLGFVFGLVRGAVLVCLAYLLLDLSVPQTNDRPVWLREAKSGPYLHEGADMLRGWLPESLRARAAGVAEEATQVLNPAAEAQRAMRALSTPRAPAWPPSPPSSEPKPDTAPDTASQTASPSPPPGRAAQPQAAPVPGSQTGASQTVGTQTGGTQTSGSTTAAGQTAAGKPAGSAAGSQPQAAPGSPTYRPSDRRNLDRLIGNQH